ncbi:MAG: hypothetical protein OES24_06795 [Acidimicrobiia bacterium]|nr:hypothetical protein [Acidimicrobiia bacterium]
MTEQAEDNPFEQLIELFVYAPIGMLYEYPEVLPQLIKKGRSQVQLAKFFGQMAARQRGASIPDGAIPGAGTAGAAGAHAADAVAKVAARFITELGAQLGLAPPSPGPPSTGSETSNGDRAAAPKAGSGDAAGSDVDDDAPAKSPTKTARLPIAGYDDLTAKEIIGLLEDLTQDQLLRVRAHEVAHRNRKTVLAKIDRLVP